MGGVQIAIIVGICLGLSSGTLLRQEADCPGEGFYRDEMDCGKFYRCVTLPPGLHADSSSSAGRFVFQCPDGTVFDQRFSTCNYPHQIDQSDSCAGQTVYPPPSQAPPPAPPSHPAPPAPVPADGSFPVLSPAGSRIILPQLTYGYQPNNYQQIYG